MFRACVGASRGLRWGVLAVAAAVLLVSVGTDPADARSRRRAKPTGGYSPPYAAIVVDANSGRVLHASNPDSLRHPASITKIMTLYLVFEQIEAGKLRLDTPLPVSAYAASQAPSKLGLRPGQTISVEDAIKALVTKSANDIAVVIAEALGGDEETFAKMMTRKARALGMTRTVYANASGLPDDEQVTTARDQAQLGRAIQDRFPRYYRYFATSSFYFGGRAIRNHNNLLGRVAGVDGIKTGFIRKSGFNLVTSVRRGNRHLVAVVIGGASAGARDARMRSLIEEYIAQGASERTVAKITESTQVAEAQQPKQLLPFLPPAQAAQAAPASLSARADTTATIAPSRQAPGSAEPIVAIPVRTLTVRPAAAAQSAGSTVLALAAAGAGQTPAPQAAPMAPPPAPPVAAAPAPAAPAGAAPMAPQVQYHTASDVAPPPAVRPAPQPATRTASLSTTEASAPAAAPAPRQTQTRSGWIIQVGAYPAESEARERLQSAQAAAKSVLGRADPFTEQVQKGSETLYRARFAGLDEARAEAACKQLKRSKIDCFTVKN
jgi:D-alanyl-D-alanine carboxypeptidase